MPLVREDAIEACSPSRAPVVARGAARKRPLTDAAAAALFPPLVPQQPVVKAAHPAAVAPAVDGPAVASVEVGIHRHGAVAVQTLDGDTVVRKCVAGLASARR